MFVIFSLVCFRSYLVVRTPFGQKLKVFTGEGRPDTVVEAWARSEQCASGGGRSKFFRR